MKEIVNRLHESRQIEKAKSILESNGFKVAKKDTTQRLDESALDQFWDLYDSNYQVGEKLEKIAADLGIDFDSEPTEEEAKQILSAYRGEGNTTTPDTADEVISGILDAIEDSSDLAGIVSRVETFEEAGLMTNNKGFVVKTKQGRTYQFSLLGSF